MPAVHEPAKETGLKAGGWPTLEPSDLAELDRLMDEFEQEYGHVRDDQGAD